MALKNSADKFGSLTKLLHWTIFLLFVLQYFLVYRREYFPKDSPEKLQYILLHKSFGLCVLVLALAMIVWRHAGVRPIMPMSMAGLQACLAKAMHFLLYLSMLLMPVSGIAMSQFAGYKVSFFGRFDLPSLLHKNEALGHIAYTIHVWSSYVIIALVSMHILASLHHHFMKRDIILKRMLPFT